jgi:hypothetical protein
MSGFKTVNGRTSIDKSVRSDLDYGVKLRTWLLPDDAVSNSSQIVWEVSAGLEKVTDAVIDHAAYGRIAFVKVRGGGPAGTQEWARCLITTDQGRKQDKTLYFNMTSTR